MQGLRRPKLKKKTQKRAKHKKKRGDFQKIPLQIYKNAVDKRTPENFGKNIRTAAASRFLAAAGIETQTATEGVNSKTRQKLHKLVRAREKWEKRHFQNLLGSAAPGLFLPSKTNLVKNSNFRKNKFVRRRKNCVKNGLQHEGATMVSNTIQPGPATQNCSETPCFSAFRVPLPLGKFVRT